MFGLTPILECDNFASNVTIPRNSIDEVIVIPSATTCENCKATCHLIQHIKLERAESQALEEYTLLVLDAEDPFLSVDPLINTNQNGSSQSYTQSEQLQHPAEPQRPSSADFPIELHSTNVPCTTTTGHTRVQDAGRSPNTIDPKSTSISRTTSHTAQEPGLCENITAGAAISRQNPTDPLDTSTPRGTCDPIDPTKTSWETWGCMIYSA